MLALFGGSPAFRQSIPVWPQVSPDEIEEVLGVLRSGKLSSLREKSRVEDFEIRFAAYHNSNHAVCMNSGTTALVAGLKALNLKPGDEVIVPSMSYIASATAVSLAGGTVVFADVDIRTHCISATSIENLITVKTKGIIAVHLGGMPCDMGLLSTLCQKYGLWMVEDCAQAVGASFNGKKVGTFGKIGVFSFEQTKNLHSGEGGCLVTNSDDVAAKVRAMINHGRSSGSEYYHSSLGGNYRMTEIQAAMLSVQIMNLDSQIRLKNQLLENFLYRFKNLDLKWVSTIDLPTEVTQHGLFSLPFVFHNEILSSEGKEVILKALQAEGLPIGGKKFIPLPDNPIYNDSSRQSFCQNIVGNIDNTKRIYSGLALMGQPLKSSIFVTSNKIMSDAIDCFSKIDEQMDLLKVM